MSEGIIERESLSMASTYWKRPIVITHGKGAILWDKDGREYIDCTSNYGVAIVGHSHPRVVEAIKIQAEKLISCHGTFFNEARSVFLEKLMSIAPLGLRRTFLSNSGTEAVEFALKLARRYSGKPGIIAMMGAFHGKTMGSLSATWNKKYRTPFQPLVPGFKHVPFGKIDRITTAIDEETAAIIVEPIQGESGINIPPDDYLKELRLLCDQRGILLILDEIQTGMGRTGKMFAHEYANIEPDILCIAKAIASGMPMGVTLAKDEIMASLKVGDHSSTFGGGPVACAAGSATIDVIRDENLLAKGTQLGEYALSKLKTFEKKYRIVREARGKGLMMALELRFDILNIILKAMDQGVLLLDAGRNIVRLLPPLIIEKEQIDYVVEVLDEVLGEEEAARIRR
jgi:acetylornithine/LysW-gamma-L-lysine aminotransferase